MGCNCGNGAKPKVYAVTLTDGTRRETNEADLRLLQAKGQVSSYALKA